MRRMKTLILILVILACFRYAGSLDHEAELVSFNDRIADRRWAAEVAASQVAR